MLYFKPPMLPGRKDVLTFDLTPQLTATGANLTGTPTVTVTVVEGVDANPTGILNGAAQIDSTTKMVLVPVAPTVDAVLYAVKVLCGTSVTNLEAGLIALFTVDSGLSDGMPQLGG